MEYTTKEIVELMEKAAQLGVCVEISDENRHLKIDGKQEAGIAAPRTFLEPKTAAPLKSKEEPVSENKTVVKSPIVGTYYASAAPEKPAFLSIGQAVKKGDVLFVIESMKLMNEVQSEYEGIVKEILVKNGQMVEFGQPVLVLE